MLSDFTFEKLQAEDLESILRIRNQEDVRNASFNKKVISFEEHLCWFKSKKASGFFHHYVLKDKENVIGVGYGENFCEDDHSCLWGFYADQNYKSGIKVGSIIKYLLFEKLFELDEIKQIRCEVLEEFEWIKDWHIRWGHKMNNFNKFKNSYEMSLDQEHWMKIRDGIKEKKLQ